MEAIVGSLLSASSSPFIASVGFVSIGAVDFFDLPGGDDLNVNNSVTFLRYSFLCIHADLGRSYRAN